MLVARRQETWKTPPKCPCFFIKTVQLQSVMQLDSFSLYWNVLLDTRENSLMHVTIQYLSIFIFLANFICINIFNITWTHLIGVFCRHVVNTSLFSLLTFSICALQCICICSLVNVSTPVPVVTHVC